MLFRSMLVAAIPAMERVEETSGGCATKRGREGARIRRRGRPTGAGINEEWPRGAQLRRGNSSPCVHETRGKGGEMELILGALWGNKRCSKWCINRCGISGEDHGRFPLGDEQVTWGMTSYFLFPFLFILFC